MKKRMRYISHKSRLSRLQLPYFFSNRNAKDRLFCYIFETDRKALLQLYNALNHTDYQDEYALQIVTLDNAVYMAMNNDVAFLLIGTLNLYEHQSTLCPNLPLRFLLYLAAEYEGLVARMNANIYGQNLIPLPAPQCVIFYNGEDEVPDEQFLRLSDAFANEQGIKPASCIELTVRMLNINHGHNPDLMAACKRLDEYSRFVEHIRKYRRSGLSTDDSIDNAVVYCIDHGIMDDILLPFRQEVKKMLLTEYNERKYMRMFRREAREEGLAEGRAEGLAEGRAEGLAEGRAEGLEQGLAQGVQKERERLLRTMLGNGASASQLSKLTGLSITEIQRIRKNKKKRLQLRSAKKNKKANKYFRI